MSLYMKAADIIKAMRHPVPCAVAAQMATAAVLTDSEWPDAWAAEVRLAANGAVRSSG